MSFRPEEVDDALASRLSDEELAALLAQFTNAPLADPARTASAVASIELEAARRGLRLEGLREGMPPALALRRCIHYIDRGDCDGAVRCMWFLGRQGVWHVRRHVNRLPQAHARAWYLGGLAWVLDSLLLGPAATRQRADNLTAAGLTDLELADYLDDVVRAHLSNWMAAGPFPY